MIIFRNSFAAVDALSDGLRARLTRDTVFLCIGSDRVTGDCLGPLCGHLLKKRYDVPAFVYGGLDCPVNALNVCETARFVTARHPKSAVVVIDSSVGAEKEIGCIRLFDGPVKPGSADGKKLGAVGDIGITATVAARRGDLGGVRLSIVWNLAETVAAAVSRALTSTYSSIASVY